MSPHAVRAPRQRSPQPLPRRPLGVLWTAAALVLMGVLIWPWGLGWMQRTPPINMMAVALALGTLSTGVVACVTAPSGHAHAITIGGLAGMCVTAAVLSIMGMFTAAGAHIAMCVLVLCVARRVVSGSDSRLAIAAGFFQTVALTLAGMANGMMTHGM